MMGEMAEMELENQMYAACADPDFDPSLHQDTVIERPRYADNTDPGVWVTKEGEIIKLLDMGTDHLINSLSLLVRRALKDEHQLAGYEGANGPVFRARMQAMQEELNRRLKVKKEEVQEVQISAAEYARVPYPFHLWKANLQRSGSYGPGTAAAWFQTYYGNTYCPRVRQGLWPKERLTKGLRLNGATGHIEYV